MDIATFRTQRPEFSAVDPDVIGAALATAARWVDPGTWGTFADDGVSLLAAHYLATAPMGGATRMAPPSADGATSTYKAQYGELVSIVGCGAFLVAGGAGTVG